MKIQPTSQEQFEDLNKSCQVLMSEIKRVLKAYQIKQDKNDTQQITEDTFNSIVENLIAARIALDPLCAQDDEHIKFFVSKKWYNK